VNFKDNGGGTDKKIVDNFFEPYFTTQHKYQGKGLSLHNTYNIIVNEIGGTIEVKNIQYNYNKKIYSGLEFTLSIPLKVKL
jgi:C4-dicarboxylate-specific signal transduction histidine kinase